MKLIDANTGKEMFAGRSIRNVLGVVKVIKIRDRIFWATTDAHINDSKLLHIRTPIHWRWSSWLGIRRVAVFPS